MPALRARRGRYGSEALSAVPAHAGRVAAAARFAAIFLVAAASLVPVRTAVADVADRFVAGTSVTERSPIEGDLFAAGGSVDVEAAIEGDAVIAGGKVRLGSDVGRSVFAAGGQVAVLGRITHNARLAGGQVQVEPTARIGGNLTAAGGRIELRGTTDGSVGAAGNSVLIDGTIGGDVDVAGASVALGPGARIHGNLRYRSGDALQRDPAAQVSGTVEPLGPELPTDSGERAKRWVGTGLAVLWTIGLTLLAAIIVALLPRATASVSGALRQRPGLALLLGFIVLVCTPVAVLMSFVTIVGIPLGLLGLLVYLMLLPLAWIATAIGIGDWFVSQLPSSRQGSVAPRVVAASLAVVLLAFVTRAPWIGGWIAFVALMAGLGALALQFRRLRLLA